MKWKSALSAAENARARLPKLAERYFASGRKALDAKNDTRALRKLLKRTEALHCALEMFAPLYGPTLDRRLRRLSELLRLLRESEDLRAVRRLLRGDAAQRANLDAAAGALRQRSLGFWRETFDAPGEMERWKACLARKMKPSPGRRKAV